MRDIRRKIDGNDALMNVFRRPLWLAERVATQTRRDPLPKVYSLHAPEVECIGKGKAAKPYEFGCKVTVTTANARAAGGQFVVHIDALHGNPDDGHTLKAAVEAAQAWTGVTVTRLRRQGIPRPRPGSLQSLEIRQQNANGRHPPRTSPPQRHQTRHRSHEN